MDITVPLDRDTVEKLEMLAQAKGMTFDEIAAEAVEHGLRNFFSGTVPQRGDN